jgi:23S rRNA (adenine2503-C2)-methyltransferase
MYYAVSDQQKSKDGTIKCAFTTFDGHITEGVLIPTTTRVTACISSQVGCSLACKFCATGRLKMMRNLSPEKFMIRYFCSPILAQEHYGQILSNIVFMGMGEPFAEL